MAKRDHISEIKGWRGRNPESGNQMEVHIDELRRLIDLTDGTIESNTAEYIVVKLVALLQSAFKNVLRAVINHKVQAREPLPELKEFKLTMSMVQELKYDAFTMGDLVSHLMALNSYEDIRESFKAVAKENFEDILLDTPGITPGGDHVDGEMLGIIRMSLTDLFKRRNIVCHEISKENIEDDSIQDWIYYIITVIQTLEKFDPEK